MVAEDYEIIPGQHAGKYESGERADKTVIKDPDKCTKHHALQPGIFFPQGRK